MESTLSLPTTLTLFTMSKSVNLHFTKTPYIRTSQLVTRRFRCVSSHNITRFSSPSSHSSSLRGLCKLVPLVRQRLECVSSAAASFGTAGGGDGGASGGEGGRGGGGGGDSSGEGDTKSNLVAGGPEDCSVLSPDVIILDVGGMTCGGCAASVKRILESQPHVSSASVNLTTETAIVWPVSEAKVAPNWQKQLGEALAKHLTSCGFTSNLRGQEAIEGDISS